MIKKLNIILVLSLLLFVSISAVSALDDTNVTLSDDGAVSGAYLSDNDEILQESNSHTINSNNYNNYFNYKTGELVSSDVKEGDTIYLDGTFDAKNVVLNFAFNKTVNVVGTSTNSMKNSLFTFYSGASGSSVSNLKISNTKDYTYGIFLNGASNCIVSDCIINNTGQSSYTICIANNANYNNITNNVLQAYGLTYGYGTRSTSPMVLCGAHYNYISNNMIICDDANAIYLSSYSGGPLKGGVSNFNIMYNNTIKYNVLPTSWGYAIQVMGGNNTIDSNRIIGAYRAISTSSGTGNRIVGNKIINITGADYSNVGVEVGGEYAIVGSAYSKIINNSIINAKIISTGSAISVLDYCVVEDNDIEVLYFGKGITPSGSNIIIKNNNISTVSGSVVYWEGQSYNLTIVGNNLTSQSGVGVLIKKTSSKKMPNSVVITDNFISTNNVYAIDAREVNASSTYLIQDNTIPKGKGIIATPEGSYDPSKPRYNFNGVTYNITPSNFDDYINVNGNLASSIKDGDILYFDGDFSNKGVIYITSPIKITGNNPTFYNTTFRLSSDGVWIENLTIKNKDANRVNAWGVLAYKISGATITNCDIEVVDPNAAYAIYVVESSDVDVLNNKLSSSGNYLTYTLLAISVEDSNFINNTIFTIGTGNVHYFENEHCVDGNETCTDGDSCVDGDSVCTDGNTVCADGDSCVDGDSVCTDGNTVCTSGNTISGNHVLKEVFRTYGILMVYSSGCNVSGNKVNVTSKLKQTYGSANTSSATIHNNIPTNSIVGIDIYYNSHNNIVSNNNVYVKANDNYIYGVGVLGYYTGHDAPEGQGATNNQFIDNNIVLIGSYFVQGIVIGDESEDTTIVGNTVNAQSNNYSYGINLEMSQKSLIKQNIFTLNSDMAYGIEAFSSNDNIINENEFDIKAKQAYGVVLSNSLNNELVFNKILNDVSGETINYKISDAVGAGVSGIYLKSNSTNNLIENNNITSKKGFAIIISNEATNNSILNNYLHSENGRGNNAINNTANNIVGGNYLYVLDGNMPNVKVNYLGSAVITANVNVDGTVVKFYVGGEEIGSAIVSNGVASLNYKFDESFIPSDYALSAITINENCSEKQFSSVLTVNKGNLNVTVQDVSGYVSESSKFIATINDNFGNPISNVNVKFYINSGRYAYAGESQSNGEGLAIFDISIPPLNAGIYEILANVTGGNNFNPTSANSSLEVKQLISTKIQFNGTKIYPTGVLAILKDVNGNSISNKNVSVTFNGNTISITTDSNGCIILPTTVRGTFDVTIEFAGDEIYKSTSSDSKITFAPVITGNKAYTVYYGNTISYKVRITGSDGNIVGAGEIVTIKVGNTVYNVKTDKNGYATKSLKLKTGSYTVTTTYNGDKVSNKITIKPTLIAKNISKKKAKTTKFTVKLVNKNGKILKNKKIIFKIKNKKYTAKTNKKGIATVSIKNLKVGKYTITSIYGGCSISNKITIKK